MKDKMSRCPKWMIFFMGIIFAAYASPTSAENPYLKPNNSWISISGTVKSVSPDSFRLDYGKGMIQVEMDDGDRDADAYKLLAGDKVTVTGFIDDDLFETTKIEAGSVYVEKLGTTFYASAVDEEDFYYIDPAPAYVVVSNTLLQGTVTDVGSEEFTVNTGKRKVTVEVDAMPYNPLDKIGYQKIQKGDRVSVSGRMDYDFFEGRELVADSIVTLEKADKKKKKS